jgi:hypothetical protein
VSSLLAAIQHEELMPSERRFRDDGTKATRFYKPNNGDDRMNEKDEDVVRAGIVSKSQELPEFSPILDSPPTGCPSECVVCRVGSWL